VGPELTTGATLGHFTILERIGAGGMGEVFRARDERLERDVAIKVLPTEMASDPRRLARFDREAKALARITHPNILAIHEFGEEDGIRFVVTELLEGVTLKDRLGERPMTIPRAIEIGVAIADGLAAAHDQGVVHRDIKPSNVFLTTAGGVKILDFGLARTDLPEGSRPDDDGDLTTSTQTGAVLGTPGYMSPEQVRGEAVDARSDIFSFGCMLYEMTVGVRPFNRNTSAETMSAILNEEPPEIAADPELERLLRRCLDKSPARRFQTADDLAYALRSQLEGAPSDARVSTVDRDGPSPLPGRRVWWIAAVGAVVAIAGLMTVTIRDEAPSAPLDSKSVAVLPFVNLTADPDQEYFCDGMSEEIINALAQVSGLRVVARTSSFAFKGQHRDVREIGRRLSVSTLIEGSVRLVGDRLRITAQLIDTETGHHLWSQNFDRRFENVFAIQDEISLAVVDTLEIELLGGEREAVTRRPTDNLEAYDACLRGWYHWNFMTPEGARLSYQYFKHALELDPNLAQAYEGLIAWHLPQTWWFELPPEVALEAIAPLSERLFELDDSYMSYGHRAYMEAYFGWDWSAADQAHQRSLKLGPNVPIVHSNYALTLLVRERFDEAVPHLRKSQELDPLSPFLYPAVSAWFSFAGLHDEALAGVKKAVELHPKHWMPRLGLSIVQRKLGLLDDARASAELAFEMSGGLSRPAADLAILSYRTGDAARGDELFEMLQQRAGETWVPPTILGWLHLARGEVDAAYGRFEEAVQRNDPWITSFRAESLVSIPDEPRFDALSERLGLPH
jgi:serine/threonine protein kinase/tetratricopeptide (TPR) repeat protein